MLKWTSDIHFNLYNDVQCVEMDTQSINQVWEHLKSWQGNISTQWQVTYYLHFASSEPRLDLNICTKVTKHENDDKQKQNNDGKTC